jgi:DNA-binding transcriptional MerR regulator
MKLTDLFKKPKKEEAIPPPPASTALPIEQVSNLKKQGYPNDQIIDYLQSQGFSAAQITDALSQVEARTPAEPFQPPARAPAQGFAPQQRGPAPDNTEEMVEAIVDEKWRNFSKDLTKFKDWQDANDSRLDKLEQGVKDIRADVESLHKAIVSKISDYDKSLMDVGTEIKAMEKVFSKVLPDLTESVSKLSSISKKPVAKKKSKK